MSAGGTDESRIFTLDECPAAEKFVAKGLARRIESLPAESPPKKSVVKSARDFLFPSKPEPKPVAKLEISPKPEPEPEPEPTPDLKVDVGIMEATLGAGADGNFGTDDDTVTIKPKPKKAGFFKGKDSKKAKKKGGKK